VVKGDNKGRLLNVRKFQSFNKFFYSFGKN